MNHSFYEIINTMHPIAYKSLWPFFSIAVILILSTAMYTRRSHTRIGRRIVPLSIAVSLSLFFHGLSAISPYGENTSFWMLGWALTCLAVLPALLYYITSLFYTTNNNNTLLKLTDSLAILYGAGIFVSGLGLTTALSPASLTYIPQLSLWVLPYWIYFGARILHSPFQNGFHKERFSDGSSPGEKRWLLLIVVAGMLPTIDFLPMLGAPVYPLGFIGILVFYGLLYYGAGRYFFLEMDASFAADQIVHTLPDPLLVCDMRGAVKVVNRAFTQAFGYHSEDITGKLLSDCAHTHNAKTLTDLLQKKKNGTTEASLYDNTSELLPVQISSSRLDGRDGTAAGIIFVIQDIREYKEILHEIEELYHRTEEVVEERTEELQKTNQALTEEIKRRKAIEEQLRHAAFHDTLTGLPNREMFSEHLIYAFNKFKHRKGLTFAILFIDLDHFKLVNDTYGHIVGDFVLKTTAHRLKECMRDVDTIGRLGGDEFVVLMDEITEPSQSIKVAERILHSMEEPILFNGLEIKPGTSIGIAFAESRHREPKEIIRDADIALYHAKQHGKNRYSLFEGELQEQAIRRMNIENALRESTGKGDFSIQYQPIIELKEGRLKGFEALIRWHHAELGQLSPELFIPIAEESELIFDIGRWVLFRACNDMATWLSQLPEHMQHITVSVNISPKQLQSPAILQDIRNALDESMLNPKNLVIEVTESAIITDTKGALATLNKLTDMGVKLHLDDFGEGYSSVNLLYRFPFDTMKIDRSYVSGLHENRDSSEVVRTIINLGHSMKKKVIAEGIETSSEAGVLKDFQCELGQGYFFSHPLDGDNARDFVMNY